MVLSSLCSEADELLSEMFAGNTVSEISEVQLEALLREVEDTAFVRKLTAFVVRLL